MKKKGVGQNKNFGPIQKLTVPDFTHIANVFEQMQSEMYDKPARARKQMKPFTIRKANVPNRAGQPVRAASQESMNQQKYATAPGERQRSMERGQRAVGSMDQIAHDKDLGDLTKEEAEALAPQNLKVVNPWIHEQTHQEYLKKITGLPARHANVISTHKHVVKETTFLPLDDNKFDKDKATREALAILDKEYDIFNDPSMLPVKSLPRYDTWDRDFTPQQWLEYCLKRPTEAHAVSPCFDQGEYTWKPVQIIGYDEKERKFKVRVMHNNKEKTVTRLSLLFYAEDPELFKERVELCKLRQKHVEQELRFTDLVDSIPSDAVSTLSKERREMFSTRAWNFIYNKFNQQATGFDADKVSDQLKKLNKVVEEEYIRQMKKCIVIKEMSEPSNFAKFAKLKVPIRINKKTNPYFGVVRCPKYEFVTYQNEIELRHWCSKKEVADMTMILAAKCIEFQTQRFMKTDKKELKLPLELDQLKDKQKIHTDQIRQNVKLQWREFLLGEMNKNLNAKYNFYQYEDKDNYECSPLKSILVRFEQILNTFLREFTQTSIQDWVAFIKTYTVPKYDKGELWPLQTEPMITIKLDIKKPTSKSSKTKSKKKEGDPAAPADDDENNKTIVYSPTLERCEDYLCQCIDLIVDANNEFQNLEAELIRFIKFDQKANFEIPKDEEEVRKKELHWILDAKQAISEMVRENMAGPQELLDMYKKYEFVLNINSKELAESMFKLPESEDGSIKKDEPIYPSANLAQIREQIERFYVAEDEILNISNNTMEFPMFRVQADRLKKQLAEKAREIKRKLCERTYKWCMDSVKYIETTYKTMENRINKQPQDEAELVEIQEFIKVSKTETKQKLEDLLLSVTRHMNMLDDYSERIEKSNDKVKPFSYEDEDVVEMYYLKSWPLRIDAAIAEGQTEMEKKTEEFNVTLETEKEKFKNDLKEYQEKFKKIQTFTDHTEYITFNRLTVDLNSKLVDASAKEEDFHRREKLFKIKESEWAELKELSDQFKPFYDLITTTNEVKTNLIEWKGSPLMTLDSYEDIDSAVQKNFSWLTTLNKKLAENDFDDVAQVAMDVRKELEEFRENLPMIKLIKSDAITAEDWQYIKDAVDKQDLEREQVTVKRFGSDEGGDNLLKYFTEIEDIVFKAEKKFTLTKKLKKLKEEMKVVELTTFKHEKANPPAWILKAYDEVNTILDDQILQAQSMQGSSYMKGKLKTDTQNYATKLDMMSQIIDQMAKCQRTWMNLEPVFSSGDIEKTLPTETHKFRDVDKVWRDTTDQINEEPGILELTERESLLNQFIDANKKLDDIQRSLNQYLEAKSLVFPRFFFLDSESLLMLLAQTKDPRAVQPHMDKLFEGIARVRFSDDEKVYAMLSAEQEEVQMYREIDVNQGDKKGNVEKWMVEIEEVMIETLRQKTKSSNSDYAQQDLETWVAKWPGQVVLAVDQINWTMGVELSFEKGNLQGALKKCNDDIQKVVRMVRGQLPSMLRVTLKALVVLQVHSKTVVETLVDQKVQEKNDFQWSSQLRYYWEDGDKNRREPDKLKVKMVTAIIDYGFEYLGNSPRLVITPLTDRCYRTLMGAKNLQYGGAPEGPAGTGKTETVKDLAKALAVQCVVFNCQDGLDHNAMAKFFKGLAASGAWCCFDEFNRIDLEVLSVIAQQILTIQNAIKARQKIFNFEGTALQLNPYCAVNITMNPGYAGRAELPDNLKALFRPCAMMVPNYALIAEIELYSFGFEKAQPIAIKVTASLILSSEQLSSQTHYDFGMRALKAILTACGNLRRKLEDWEEDKLGLRALNDVNKPKFTQNDVELYAGITADLFPNVELPTPDYSTLTNAMLEQCKLTNLQPKPIFLQKCIELYETICVRHGLMVVGGAFSGKSKVINTLCRSMAAIQGDPNFEHNVENYFINPKSVLQEQLYGKFDADTGEWSDGVLAITIRDCAESETPDRKWIIFDGPVDAVWIENMNTVLDDNKKLCLSSGQIIKLKPTMTLMFEVEDLAEASPATVSRCGMVLLEVHSLGHNVLIDSYCKHLQKFIPDKVVAKLAELMHYCSNILCEFIRTNCKQAVTTGPNFLVNNMIQVLDTFVTGWDEEIEQKTDDPDAPTLYKTPKEAEEILNNALLYSLIWGMGAQIEETTRVKFDKVLIEMLNQENIVEKYNLDLPDIAEPKKIPAKLSEYTSLFDLCYNPENLNWINWLKTVPDYHVPLDCSYASIVVPTLDSIRVNNNLNRLLNAGKHTLIVGPTGTGKSISVVQELKKHFNNESYIYLSLAFSAQTSANQTQNIIDGKMTRRRKGHFGPPPGQQCIIFVDDLNMPRKEKYGAQPPIELLRQWMDYGGWYDIGGEKEFKHIQDVKFCAAMGPPGISGNPITNRYVRHYNILYIEPYSAQSQHQIFSHIMDWTFGRECKVPWNTTVKNLKDTIVQATIECYQAIQKTFKPTPAKSHYTYNLRDVSKVFQGISKSEPRALLKDDDMIKLWSHECQRVFSDRLISQEDRDNFMVMLKQQVKQRFRKDYDKIVEVKPLLFASYVPTIYAETDVEKKKPLMDIYCELIDKERMRKRTESMLEEFNTVNRTKKMDLVLFTDAIEHIVKIHRVITTQYGNALLVGVGGSGRKSLTELANFIASYDIVVLEMPTGYDFKQWRDEVKDKLFIQVGCEKDIKPVVFLFSDTQIINEMFLEDINNILNNGKIPNLYNREDEDQIQNEIKEAYKGDMDFKEIMDDQGKIFELFERQARDSLHVVLAMSPIGDAFKVRLRMFPALVNCCTIDWFLPWPKDALQSVAEKFLKNVDDLPQRDGIVQICVDMQSRAMNMTERYRLELSRYYYITPTSYLILIKTFTTLLEKRRKLVNTEIYKFDRGLSQLDKAERLVGDLRKELEALIPELEIAAKQSAEQQKVIEVKKKEVDAQKAIAASEAAIAKEQKDAATIIKEDCDKALAQVMPIYNAAVKAVKALKAADITELRGTKVPSAGMKVLAQVLCMFFNIKPKIIKAQTAKDADQQDYWDPCKSQLLGATLLAKLQDYKKDEVPEELVIAVNPILNSPDMSKEKMQQTSVACFGISEWCKAIIKYHEAMKIVKPKQIELAAAEEKSAAAKRALDEANESLAKVEALFAELVRQLQEAQNKEADLKAKKDDCEYKVALADSLINGLKGERENWVKLLALRRSDKEALVGDTIVCSGFLAYLGVFVTSYRTDCVREWSNMLQQFNIGCTPGLDLVKVLGNPVKIAKWQKYGLPQDNFSTENAIIWKNSDRWTLCIDPQMQANKWLKSLSEAKMGDKKLVHVLKPTTEQKLITRVIENAMSMGQIVIFEDANETFDPLFDSLLAKQLKKEGADWMINFGGALKVYDQAFKFYITTKIARPHYSPEICTKVTMINFMVMPEGLQDQISSVILRIEEHKKYTAREKCISDKADFDKQIKQKQDEILNLLANSSDNILEDKELKSALDESQDAMKLIADSMAMMEKTMKGIDASRREFQDIALRVSRLFFVLTELININDMYQYSLDFFVGIFEKVLTDSKLPQFAEAEGLGDKKTKLKWFISEFQKRLFKQVSWSLFENHKLLFAFLITLKVMDEIHEKEHGGVNTNELRFMMAGSTKVQSTNPNPTGGDGWLSDKNWCAIEEMSELFPKYFGGFDKSFAENIKEWQKLYEHATPQTVEKWPITWQNNPFELIHKTMIMRIIRPDKVSQMVYQLVLAQMGEYYVKPVAFDIAELYGFSNNNAPIILVISPGADPMSEIQKFSVKEKVKVESISLGKGQDKKAVEAIKSAQTQKAERGTEGCWVVLQNCHLCPSFMPKLDAEINLVKRIEESSFRIWLTTMPSDKFPVTIVQNGLKATSEPPKGLKPNIIKSFRTLITDAELKDCNQPVAFKKLVYGLCFFNAVILERRKFGALGWNVRYQFSVPDLDISKQQLYQFLNHFEDIPFVALNYMVAEANYGGRVTDPKDRRCIITILQDYYNEDLVNQPNYKLSGSSSYLMPNVDEFYKRDDFVNYIEKSLPFEDMTEIFGMHDNAEVTSAINFTNEFLASALTQQPRAIAAGGGKTPDQILDETATGILNKLPAPFDLEAAARKHPLQKTKSMNTVLQQEILRFNKLLNLIRSHLKQLKQAIKGEVVMSPDLEIIQQGLFDNKIPELWSKRSYPSMKPLASYIVDFAARLKFIQDWIDNDCPPVFWLSGFYFTQSFLTGLKQDFARKFTIAIDKIDFTFHVISDESKYDLTKAAPDGAYVDGLFIEGCRWDDKMGVLAESLPKVLLSKMPRIWMKPQEVDAKTGKIDHGHIYVCPLYKTLERFGTLSTTGHSTNYVVDVMLPIQQKHPESHWIKRGVAMVTQDND